MRSATNKKIASERQTIARFPPDAQFPGEGPIRNLDWFKDLWTQRRSQWWTNRQADKGSVVFVGDSIIHKWDSLAVDFPKFKLANRGITGDVTRSVLYRLKVDVLDLNPSAVVLLIGTNDLEEGCDPAVIAKNIKEILDACLAHNPNMPVIVCKVMPSSASRKRPAVKVHKINTLVDDMIVRSGPPLMRCDTYSIFANEQGDAKTEEFPDLLHPNASGYAKLAAALHPIFAALRLE
jgi:lysophospholipase L1-like esterase